MDAMDPSLEIRKLPASAIRELAFILEYNDFWKRLMAIIPKELCSTRQYDCVCTTQKKYKSEHFRLIESASQSSKRSCTEILLDEWGTSGRIRPALGHLLYFLIQAELFRAADYVAVDLLKQDPPERPVSGPAALVTTHLPEMNKSVLENILNEMQYSSSLISDVNKSSKDNLRGKVEQELNKIDYPSSLYENLNNESFNTNLDYNKNDGSETTTNNKVQDFIIPKIVVSEIPSETNRSAFNTPLVVLRKNESHITKSNNSSSNLINFNSTSQNVPQISMLINDNNDNNQNVPWLSMLIQPESPLDSVDKSASENNCENSSETSVESDVETPNLSIFNANKSQEIPALSQLLIETDTPNVNASKTSDSESLSKNTDTNPQNSSDDNQPLLSALMANENTSASTNLEVQSTSNTTKNLSDYQTQTSNISRSSRTTCISPLPNLTLNTILEHFTYAQLELATNNFDETPHKNSLQVENSREHTQGRFLGCGAFGSVYLALDLLDRPVAVKKLHLNDVELVNPDDTVTIQFRNEVEVLCEYKHENLLSLVGYSCDGPTYCLIYEYISGGALKDRLQNVEHRLVWRERLNIALETANAIAYLHTARTSPLIHRDIKSANILLNCSNKPKLCDFGLIKLTSNQHTNTTTTVYGTSAYMAPEAFRGDVSVKTDTFSFGVVLLELLTALPPLDKDRKKGCDIITYIQENCEDGDITKFLDVKSGSWEYNGINFAADLFSIATKCLEEKKKRPDMVEVSSSLSQLLQKLDDS